MSGVSRWLEWLATNMTGAVRLSSRSRPSTVGSVSVQTSGLKAYRRMAWRVAFAAGLRAQSVGNA